MAGCNPEDPNSEYDYYLMNNYPLKVERIGNIGFIYGFIYTPEPTDNGDYNEELGYEGAWIPSLNDGNFEDNEHYLYSTYNTYTLPKGFESVQEDKNGNIQVSYSDFKSFAAGLCDHEGRGNGQFPEFATINVEKDKLVTYGFNPGEARAILATYYVYDNDYYKDFDENGYLKKELRG